jgi:general stress protein YciG
MAGDTQRPERIEMAGRGFDDKDRAAAAGKKGAETLKERFGREHFVSMGKNGGASNRDKHGPDHFKELGRQGGKIRWERERARKAALQAEAEPKPNP